ncbi:MAG: aminotransferase class I/II-fold pyridoxal phosphate-dependent enzyme [Oscillospiraceae bacterium]|nr:aminotransferase class I/II-fold pyridoxal phosphate-dependent enzyme [Oscillospiraceae bacterium]
MIRFACDYAEGCHPTILAEMTATNMHQMPGYGEDEVCAEARARILQACCAPESDVHFLVGGTQANLTVIGALLRPYEGVLSADSGHVNVHETGAIEATGHKVLALPHVNGKISAEQVRAAMQTHLNDEARTHTVKPGMVYISQPTEYGTLYSLAELEALAAVCAEYGLPLFADGARLGYALASSENDATLADLARLCDVFYIGGTKCGALFGEAVVIRKGPWQKDFRYNLKQRGGLLAKGWLLGRQFKALFTDGLYDAICRKAVDQAERIQAVLREKNVPIYLESPTNQIFCVFTEAQLAKLAGKYAFSDNGPVEGGRLIRICTSWATEEANVQQLIADIAAL